MWHYEVRAAILVGFLLAVAGCGGGKYQPVEGQIVFPDGSPVTGLEGGQVIFEGAGPDGQSLTASGSIDAQGKFVLGTESLADGAVAGKNKVLITPPTATGDVPPPPVIDARYERFETSGIELEVQPGANSFQITVEPAKTGS